MCQLLGMNCAAPTDFSFSLRGFCRRGGETDIHSHGWGLCLYEGRGVRSFHDTLPASKSPIADLVQNYPMRTFVRTKQTTTRDATTTLLLLLLCVVFLCVCVCEYCKGQSAD